MMMIVRLEMTTKTMNMIRNLMNKAKKESVIEAIEKLTVTSIFHKMIIKLLMRTSPNR